jgi:hypothetical protein
VFDTQETLTTLPILIQAAAQINTSLIQIPFLIGGLVGPTLVAWVESSFALLFVLLGHNPIVVDGQREFGSILPIVTLGVVVWIGRWLLQNRGRTIKVLANSQAGAPWLVLFLLSHYLPSLATF